LIAILLPSDAAVYFSKRESFESPPPRGAVMANPFVHVELMSTDVNRSKEFYGKLFDWKMQDMPNPATGTYTLINVGEGTGGGMMKNPMPGAPSSWMAYVLVDDVKAATSKAKSLGANVMKDVNEVPNMGWFSIITDPTGAMLGLWQAKVPG
jgi:predicted enzyme related to lactoylglutathione lyase